MHKEKSKIKYKEAELYAQTYPDLLAAFGYDEEALYQHYISCGIAEGRTASTVLDIAKYRDMYPDLAAAFGNNWDAYADHYLTCGIAEGIMRCNRNRLLLCAR